MTARRERRRAGAVVAVAALLAAAMAVLGMVPAEAQSVDPSTPDTTVATTSGTIAASTSVEPAPTVPTTFPTSSEVPTSTVATAPGGSGTTTTTTPGGTTTTISAPPKPGTDPVADPVGAGDAPSEAVPESNLTVPPRLAGDPILNSSLPGSKVVIGELSTAKAELLAAQSQRDAAVAKVDSLQHELEQVLVRVARVKGDQVAKVKHYAVLRQTMADRTADAYIGGLDGADSTMVLIGSRSATDYGQRKQYVQSVLESLYSSIREVQAARAALGPTLLKEAQRYSELTLLIAAARVEVRDTTRRLFTAGFAVQVFAAGSQIFVSGFVFPVADPHTFVDSFGAPRLFGTPDAHYHEGTDIMAAAGTPEFACERGVITKVNPSKLGGNGLWIKGESNVSYYYAHLSSYAPGIHIGQVVEAGTTVGFVGSTGDAQASAPHLHFEIHPNGGPAINPYPLLKVIDDVGHGRPVTAAPKP